MRLEVKSLLKEKVHVWRSILQACKRYFLKVIRYRFSYFSRKCNYYNYNYIFSEVIPLQLQLYFRYFAM